MLSEVITDEVIEFTWPRYLPRSFRLGLRRPFSCLLRISEMSHKERSQSSEPETRKVSQGDRERQVIGEESRKMSQVLCRRFQNRIVLSEEEDIMSWLVLVSRVEVMEDLWPWRICF